MISVASSRTSHLTKHRWSQTKGLGADSGIGDVDDGKAPSPARVTL